jgi:GNAT superfamily N-acetyltransferase
MITINRTDSDHPHFRELVRQLDLDLAERDGKDHAFYAQFNKVDMIKHVVLAYDGDKPVGCGAIKPYGADTMEVKRMYVLPGDRGKGIATTILTALEQWSMELSCEKCILETGKRQPEAIRLYQKNGYRVIPNYGQYVNAGNSVCFEKELEKPAY